jgi:hypothetical protein
MALVCGVSLFLDTLSSVEQSLRSLSEAQIGSAQEPRAMITPGRHRPLAQEAWNESTVRVAIEEIAADAIAHFDPDSFWPAHPSDDGTGDGDPSFYKGAAGVLWALDYLHRIGATRVAEDFRPVLPKLMKRTIIDFAASSPIDYEMHGSLLRGDMGTALLAMRLAPTSSLADLVHKRADVVVVAFLVRCSGGVDTHAPLERLGSGIVSLTGYRGTDAATDAFPG